VIQRQGFYPPPPGASPIPGLEVSGQVVAMGAGVTAPFLGQMVCALVSGGGYAEYCLAEAALCLPVPDGLAADQAAALPETLFTVWHNVFERGWATEGERLLVHGGTSGIGTTAILLGKLFGLTVIVTCGGPEKCAAALALGAAHAIDYKTTDFVEEVARITDGKGVHLVLDMVAGDYVARNLKCLGDDGRHVTIAVQGGVRAELNMAEVMRRRLTLTGSTLRPRTNEFKGLLADEIHQTVWPLVAEGLLRPVMDQAFPLREAAAAHARMEAGAHIGKIVLTVSE
jgi:putative PIG3 family NAD(P)H quinone oxidoreductase